MSKTLVSNVAVALLSLLFLSVCVVSLITFHQLRWHPAIRVRHADLVLIQGITQSIFLIYSPLFLLFFNDSCCDGGLREGDHRRYSSSSSSTIVNILRIFFTLIVSLLFPLYLIILTFRMHFIWFDLGLNSAKADRVWQTSIERKRLERLDTGEAPSVTDTRTRNFTAKFLGIKENSTESFFLNYQHTFGNQRFLLRYVVSLLLLSLLILMLFILFRTNGFIRRPVLLFQMIFAFVCSIPLTIYIFTVPKMDDFWKLRKELRVLIAGFMTATLVTAASMLSVSDTAAIDNEDEPSVQLTWFLFTSLLLSSFTIICQTTGVLWMNQLPILLYNIPSFAKEYRRTHVITGNPKRPGIESTTMGSQMSQQSSNYGGHGLPDASMRDVIMDADGFKLFCRHLVREFNIENMLFLIETQQFADYMMPTQLSTDSRPPSMLSAQVSDFQGDFKDKTTAIKKDGSLIGDSSMRTGGRSTGAITTALSSSSSAAAAGDGGGGSAAQSSSSIAKTNSNSAPSDFGNALLKAATMEAIFDRIISPFTKTEDESQVAFGRIRNATLVKGSLQNNHSGRINSDGDETTRPSTSEVSGRDRKGSALRSRSAISGGGTRTSASGTRGTLDSPRTPRSIEDKAPRTPTLADILNNAAKKKSVSPRDFPSLATPVSDKTRSASSPGLGRADELTLMAEVDEQDVDDEVIMGPAKSGGLRARFSETTTSLTAADPSSIAGGTHRAQFSHSVPLSGGSSTTATETSTVTPIISSSSTASASKLPLITDHSSALTGASSTPSASTKKGFGSTNSKTPKNTVSVQGVNILKLEFHKETVPISEIVASSHELSEHEMCVLLFLKYIPSGAEHRINLSSACLTRLLGKFSYEGDKFVRRMAEPAHLRGLSETSLDHKLSQENDTARESGLPAGLSVALATSPSGDGGGGGFPRQHSRTVSSKPRLSILSTKRISAFFSGITLTSGVSNEHHISTKLEKTHSKGSTKDLTKLGGFNKGSTRDLFTVSEKAEAKESDFQECPPTPELLLEKQMSLNNEDDHGMKPKPKPKQALSQSGEMSATNHDAAKSLVTTTVMMNNDIPTTPRSVSVGGQSIDLFDDEFGSKSEEFSIMEEETIVQSYRSYTAGAKLLMAQVSPFELCLVFDEARREAWQLLKDAYSRFVTTVEYQKWLKNYNPPS